MQHKEFLHDHVLVGDRVALDRPGSRRMKKHETAQTLSSAFVLIAALSRNAIVADQTLVVTARLDRAPAHRFVIQERAARPLVVSAFGMPAIGLLTQPYSPAVQSCLARQNVRD